MVTRLAAGARAEPGLALRWRGTFESFPYRTTTTPRAPPMTPLSYDELESAFFWVSAGTPFENSAYICRETAQVYLQSDVADSDEDIPDDVTDETRYVSVPHKNVLGLGRDLVFAFASEALPEDMDRVRAFFSRRGAYARFKDLLERRGELDQWYEFEQKATEAALHEWARENGLDLSEPTRPSREDESSIRHAKPT